MQTLHDGVSYLYRFIPYRNTQFVVDWKVLPSDGTEPTALSALAGYPSYPTADQPAARALEGYVDTARISNVSGCVRLARREEAAADVQITLEISPYGAAEVFVDNALKVGVPPRSALLGRGVFLPIALARGPHILTIRSCPYEGRNGFYVVRRG